MSLQATIVSTFLARQQVDYWRAADHTDADMLRAIHYDGEPVTDDEDLVAALAEAHRRLGRREVAA